MFCEKCGNPLPDGSKFCTACGAAIKPSDTLQSPPEHFQQTSAGQEPSYQEQFYQGQPYQGQPYQGQPYQGQPYQGQPYQGQPYQGQPYQGQPYQGQPYQGQPYQGQPYQGQQFSGASPAGPQVIATPGHGSMAGAVAHGAANAAMAGHRAASRGRRTVLLAFLVLGILAIAAILYTVFLKKGTPEQTIQKLEEGLNNLDQAQVLECFDDQMNSLYSGAIGIGEALTDLPLGDLADLGSGLGGIMSAAGMTPKYDIDILDIDYSDDGDSCIVYVNMSYSFMGESESEEASLPMSLEGREWLISMSGLESLEGLMN